MRGAEKENRAPECGPGETFYAVKSSESVAQFAVGIRAARIGAAMVANNRAQEFLSPGHGQSFHLGAPRECSSSAD